MYFPLPYAPVGPLVMPRVVKWSPQLPFTTSVKFFLLLPLLLSSFLALPASPLLPCSLQWCWTCASSPCLPCLDPKSASVSHHSLSLPHLLLLSLHACSWSPAQVLMWKWEGTWPFTVWPLNASTKTLLPSVCLWSVHREGKELPDPTFP